MNSMTVMLAALTLTPSAPIPKPEKPNPLGYAFIGVRLANTALLQIEPPEPGSPAYRAGLQGGDTLVRLGSLTPNTFEQVAEYILTLRPGTKISIDVRRNDRIVTVWLELGLRPTDPSYPHPYSVIARMKGKTNDDD